VVVTLMVRKDLGSLRKPVRLEIIKGAISDANERFGMRIVAYGIDDSIILLMIEAANQPAITLGMQGLSIRIARRLNRELGRKGEVYSQRYHLQGLKTEEQARSAVMCIHWQRAWRLGDPWNVDRFTSASKEARWLDDKLVIVRPRSALLTRAESAPG